MLRHLSFSVGFVLFLVGCNSHPVVQTGRDSFADGHRADSGREKAGDDPGILTITPTLFNKYQEACRLDTNSYDQKFIAGFFDIIKRFNGKRLDTTILTIGHLTGDGPDTIVSRVFYDGDEVHVDSKWIRKDRVIWKDSYTNPYTGLAADLMDSAGNSWIYFAVGVLYGPPGIHSRNDVDSGALSVVYNEGLDDLKKAGISIDEEQYKTWLRDFKGDLLAYGQPESREGLWIWYKPAGRFITYYHP